MLAMFPSSLYRMLYPIIFRTKLFSLSLWLTYHPSSSISSFINGFDHKIVNKQKGTRVGTFEVCVPTHIALRIFIMQVLTSQLLFLVNRNAGQAIPPLCWPVNCIKIGGDVTLLSDPTVNCLYCGFDSRNTPETKVFEVCINYCLFVSKYFSCRRADLRATVLYCKLQCCYPR